MRLKLYLLKSYLLLSALLIMGGGVFAQKTITGMVTAEDGSGLESATVIVVGTTAGAYTDENGNFSINAPEEASQIQVSMIGFTTQVLTIGDQTVFHVTLAISDVELDEVIVTGYGTQKKKDKTGAITVVDSKDFNGGAIVNSDQLISGRISGVQVLQNNGEPGGQSSIRIRGTSSILASNEPLYVIDGVPINNTPHNPGGFSGGRNPLNMLNPNDIESFTVLKDASATAIYGSRAAGGVILITTKRGKAGGRVTYDGYVSVTDGINTVDVLKADEFAQIVRDEAPNRESWLGTSSTDWQKEIQRSASGQSHHFSFSGGSANMSYRASVGYQDQEGIINNSKTQRTSFNINYNHQLFDDHLTISANIIGAQIKDQFNDGGAVGSSIAMDPTQSVLDSGSVYGGYWEWDKDLGTKNPVASNNLTQDRANGYESVGNVTLDYKMHFFPNLKAVLKLGYDINNGERRRYLPSFMRAQYSDSGEVRSESYQRSNVLLDFYFNWNQTFENISSTFDVTAGYEYIDFDNSFTGFRAWTLSTDLLGPNSTAPAANHLSFISVNQNRLVSFFGRVNYTFKERYLLTLTIRTDGSSRFGPENRWGVFPSAAFAWRMTEENFMQGSRDWLSDLKLRLGFGVVGNQEFADYLYIPRYTFGDVFAQYQFGDQFVTTVRPDGYDPGLRWEQTTSYNIGLDYGFFNGRFSGSIEYYYKKTKDLLNVISVPAGSNLTNQITTNIGSVENSGFEFSFQGYVIDNPKFRWNLGLNFSTNQDKILSLDRADDPDFVGYPTGGISGGVGNTIQILRVGERINTFYVFKHLTDPETGGPRRDGVDYNGDGKKDLADMYADTNGDGKVDDTDKIPFKGPNARMWIGLTSTFEFAGFDLSFLFRANFGNYVYNNVRSSTAYLNRIKTEIVLANMERDVLSTGFTRPQYFSDYYVEDASFGRLDYVTLGYTFKRLWGRLGMRVYVTGQNLFVVTNYKGLDPESSGIDNNNYPRARTILGGISIDL